MALKILNPGTASPLGQFDMVDGLTPKGGEVASFTGVTFGGSDQAAADEQDGYSGTTTKVRPAATTNLTSLTGPLFLTDDGTVGYGTLFGSVVGGVAGQQTSGAVLGPHTATGSGKLTLWGAEGLYGVTLDALDATMSPSIAITPGAPLYATIATGALRADTTTAFNTNQVVARFVEYATDGSLVRTPTSLVASVNSPTSDLSSVQKRPFTMAVIYWLGN